MSVPPPPPRKAEELSLGTRLVAGLGEATVIADMDFETYSEVGLLWSDALGRWVPPYGGKKSGLELTGLQPYAEHPTTEVLCLAYNLKDGRGPRLWTPGKPNPQDLFDYLAAGGLIEAFNATFEERIWTHVCVPKYGWPPLPYDQLRCAAAKARAFCLPPSLAKVGEVLSVEEAKNPDGKRLLNKFSKPRKPTKKKPQKRLLPTDDLLDGLKLYRYCLQDIRAEAECSARTPDLVPSELAFWQVDQECNRAGLRVDRAAVTAAISMLDEMYGEATEKLQGLTDGKVSTVSEVAKITAWLAEHGVYADSLDEEGLGSLLEGELPDVCRKVLEIRAELNSAAVKKLHAMRNQMTDSDRVHDCHLYHGARTGRDTGVGIQVQNMPNNGPMVRKCGGCGQFFDPSLSQCPYCQADTSLGETDEWNAEAADQAIEALKKGTLPFIYREPIKVLSGCVRGMLIADEGHDFIGSDYSAIEAVVAAALTGEQWRLDVFNNREDIYLASASKITGRTLEEYKAYKKEKGSHHPDRKLGKVAELASGYGGWVSAWKAFGADKFMSDEEIKSNLLAWREASPRIEQAWGGQMWGKPWDGTPFLYGLEGAFLQAVSNPNTFVPWRNGVGYIARGKNVYCVLPSGRSITYHNVFIQPHRKWEGLVEIGFMGYNTNIKMGPKGWVALNTYGGRLFENVVQAVARDIMAHAAVNLNAAGYKVRLRVHDEIVTCTPVGWGSVEEMERIMNQTPAWAAGWPVRASGGWRGKRFRK